MAHAALGHVSTLMYIYCICLMYSSKAVITFITKILSAPAQVILRPLNLIVLKSISTNRSTHRHFCPLTLVCTNTNTGQRKINNTGPPFEH